MRTINTKYPNKAVLKGEQEYTEEKKISVSSNSGAGELAPTTS